MGSDELSQAVTARPMTPDLRLLASIASLVLHQKDLFVFYRPQNIPFS